MRSPPADLHVNWNRVPIFPLQTVFFPRTQLPLHIFESRYRKMTADCIEAGMPMAIVLARPGEDLMGHAEVFRVAGIGTIERHERLQDGRYNLLLRGTARVRIVEELPHRPYRLVRATPLEDRWPAGGAASLAKDEETLRACVSRLVAFIGDDASVPDQEGSRASIAADVRRRVAAATDPAMLADTVASLFVEDGLGRQTLLEELDVAKRLASVTSTLAELLLRAESARGGGTLQ